MNSKEKTFVGPRSLTEHSGIDWLTRTTKGTPKRLAHSPALVGHALDQRANTARAGPVGDNRWALGEWKHASPTHARRMSAYE